ncbi:MAG TPA: hypothetical protein VHM19_14060 [Polyangiales bacterium]|nr:hypothetical protein [Polyangiales bacterium]
MSSAPDDRRRIPYVFTDGDTSANGQSEHHTPVDSMLGVNRALNEIRDVLKSQAQTQLEIYGKVCVVEQVARDAMGISESKSAPHPLWFKVFVVVAALGVIRLWMR